MTQPAPTTISFDALVPSTGTPGSPPVSKPVLPATVSDPQDMGRVVNAKKAEYLSDLEQLYPGLQEPGSGWSLIIERKQPKMSPTGQKIDGIIPEHYSANVGGNNILTEEGFRDIFGHGVYEVRVQGPHKDKIGPNGYPAPHVYAEIKLNLPQETMPVGPYPYPMPQQQGSNAAADQAVGVLGKLALEGFGRNQNPPPLAQAHMDEGTANLARGAMDQAAAAAESARIALQNQVTQLSGQLEELNRRYLDAVTTSRTNPEADRYREQAIAAAQAENTRLRDQYDQRIERMQRDERDALDRIRRDSDDRIQKLQNDLQNVRSDVGREYNERLDRIEKLSEDRFRNERMSFESQIASLKSDLDRERTLIRGERDRDVISLKADRDRDVAALHELYKIQIQGKDSAHQQLIQELAKANLELEGLRRQLNVPLEQQLVIMQKRQQLIEELTGGGGGKEGPAAMSNTDKLIEMAKPALPELIKGLMPMIQKAAGVSMPAIVAPPPGQQPAQLPAPPMQRQQLPPQQVSQRPRQQRPQGPQGPVAPPAQVQGQPPATPAPPPGPSGEQLSFRGPAPMSQADLAGNLPIVEQQFGGAMEAGMSPADFVQLAETNLGLDTMRGWINWIDGANAVLLLDRLSEGKRGWSLEGPSTWVREVWRLFEERMVAVPPAAPQTPPVEEPPAPQADTSPVAEPPPALVQAAAPSQPAT